MRLGTIVEGHGEVEAVPILVRRIVGCIDPGLHVDVLRPHRLSRGQLVKEPELKRAVELVARRAGPRSPILVLLDADEDAACSLGPRLLTWAREQRSDREISIVLPVREFEAWFLAAAGSLSGRRTLPGDLVDVADAEARVGPKAWLDARMTTGYSETLDQPALADAVDLVRARAASSFDKFVRDLARLVARPAPPR